MGSNSKYISESAATQRNKTDEIWKIADVTDFLKQNKTKNSDQSGFFPLCTIKTSAYK